MEAEALYLEHLAAIGLMAESLCRRSGITGEDAEDFASDVRLKLCEDDYAVIRKFQGKSSLSTYLCVVIGNQFRDYRISKWGKWRPSAQAKRLGDLAVQLETLIFRDGHSLESASHVIEQRTGHPADRAELRRLVIQLPLRAPRQKQGDDDPSDLSAAERTDGAVLDAESEQQLAAAEASLRRTLEGLPDEDRLIIRLLYFEGLSVADVAHGLKLEQKRLYPRIRHMLNGLAASLRGDGITRGVLDFLDSI